MKKIWKYLFIVIIISLICFGTKITFFSSEIQKVSASESKTIIIYNENLRNAIRDILDKENDESLYSDDFLKSEKFKSTTTINPETGVSTTTAENYQLDLSNTNVKDIRELCQFEFPSTLQAINLSGNNINNSHLNNILSLIDSKSQSYNSEENKYTQNYITILDENFQIRTDFNTLIKKINLNDNDIDLNTISSDILNDSRIIFGVQKLSLLDSSGLTLKGEQSPKYYIKNDDYHYLSFYLNNENAINNDLNNPNPQYGKVNLITNEICDLITDLEGIYILNISSLKNTSTAYFTNYSLKKKFILFSAKIKDDFTVERGHMLNLHTVNNHITSTSYLEISGLGPFNSFTIDDYTSPDTTVITKTDPENLYLHETYVTISKNEFTRTIPLKFTVVDKIKPVIISKDGDYIYSSQNKEFKDPEIIYYDPIIEGDDYSENLITNLTFTNNKNEVLDITTLGKYTITYTVTDEAGNSNSIPITVEIIEKALDRIYISTTSENIKKDSEIILSVQPERGTPVSNFSEFTYYWFKDNSSTPFAITKGDTNGKSTVPFIPDKTSTIYITVKIEAKQKNSDILVKLSSEKFEIRATSNDSSTQSIIVASAIAIVLILSTFGIVYFVKIRKSKNISSKKSNTKANNNTQNHDDSIKIIKNEKNPNDTQNIADILYPKDEDKFDSNSGENF